MFYNLPSNHRLDIEGFENLPDNVQNAIGENLQRGFAITDNWYSEFDDHGSGILLVNFDRRENQINYSAVNYHGTIDDLGHEIYSIFQSHDVEVEFRSPEGDTGIDIVGEDGRRCQEAMVLETDEVREIGTSREAIQEEIEETGDSL